MAHGQTVTQLIILELTELYHIQAISRRDYVISLAYLRSCKHPAMAIAKALFLDAPEEEWYPGHG